MTSDAKTVREYLDSLPEERRRAVAKVSSVVRKHIPPGYEEGMQSGMVCWFIPLSHYPDTYNRQPLAVVSLASRKSYVSLYLMGVYGIRSESKWFEGAFRKAGKKLDMGKSCVRFRNAEDLPLDVIGEAVARVPVEKFIEVSEKSRRR